MKEKILLALSDKKLIDILSDFLTKKELVVDSVSDGNDVLTKIKSFSPDLLLIDTVLPNKSGYDVLSEKSFDRDTTKVPVIIVSNAGEPIHIRRIPSTPVIKDFIIRTHVDPEEVFEKIEKIFGRGPIVTNYLKEKVDIGKGRKILWVEDDKLLSNILSRKFESAGFHLLKANREDDALKIVETEIPDVIILDILLPGMNGFEILQKFRMNSKLKNVPVMMLSNLNKPSDIDKARSLGANKFLVKAAVSLDEIVHEVNEILS